MNEVDRVFIRRVLGATLCIFAIFSLCTPGRLDIVDGHTRYEVARSIVDHGDFVVRDPDAWFAVLPGRAGENYSFFRLPQSVLGVVAILSADLMGPISEPRRHFFFSLVAPAMGSLLLPLYAIWFRRWGFGLRWAILGVLATPCWYYSTTTFDDILGTTAVVAAVVVGFQARRTHPMRYALLGGLLIGWGFNCKQPLGIYALAAAAAVVDPFRLLPRQWRRLVLVGLGVGCGIAAYLVFERWKFPPGTTDAHPEILARYLEVWFANPLLSWPALLLSPGTSFFLFCPTIFLSVAGACRVPTELRRLVVAIGAASAVFFAVTSLTTFFKGDPCWGPRYFTPFFAVLWLFTPFAVIKARARNGLLAFGVVVQLLAITVDPHRLYVERSLPNAWSAVAPELLFHPQMSHLLNRPREIGEILTRPVTAREFSPGMPTKAIPMVEDVGYGAETIERYAIFQTFRPWWCSHRYMPPDSRPVPIRRTAAVFLAILAVGAIGVRTSPARRRKVTGEWEQ